MAAISSSQAFVFKFQEKESIYKVGVKNNFSFIGWDEQKKAKVKDTLCKFAQNSTTSFSLTGNHVDFTPDNIVSVLEAFINLSRAKSEQTYFENLDPEEENRCRNILSSSLDFWEPENRALYTKEDQEMDVQSSKERTLQAVEKCKVALQNARLHLKVVM